MEDFEKYILAFCIALFGYLFFFGLQQLYQINTNLKYIRYKAEYGTIRY